MSLRRVRAWFASQIWALDEAAYETVAAVFERRVDEGLRLTAQEVRAALGLAEGESPTKTSAQRAGTVAVVPVHGLLAQRANVLTDVSGASSSEQIGRAFATAVHDPQVSAVVLDVDSPGGSVFGIEELARAIYEARGEKPIVAVANSQATSAAYWIASAADSIVVTPGGQVGSIGVFAEHEDRSAAAERDGVRTTLVRAGRFKAEDHPSLPFNEDARAAWQHKVDHYYDLFVKAVARGRGVAPSAVRDGFGEGRTLVAPDALAAGMVDRIDTLEATVTRLQSPQGRTAALRAADAEWKVRAELQLLSAAIGR